MNWQVVPGQKAATDIGVNSLGDLWILNNVEESGGYGIYNFKNGSWKKVSGSAIRIAVSPTGPWVVNKYGNIYVLDDKTEKWTMVKGCAKDIGAGADG